MKTSTRAPRRRPKAAHAPVEPTTWAQLQEYLATEPMDDMLDSHPELAEALALIKYAGPEIQRVETLTVALRLLVGVAIEIARDIHLLEPTIVKACNLLHNHISEFGLIPNEGKWYLMDCLSAHDLSTPERQFRAATFVPHPVGGE